MFRDVIYPTNKSMEANTNFPANEINFRKNIRVLQRVFNEQNVGYVCHTVAGRRIVNQPGEQMMTEISLQSVQLFLFAVKVILNVFVERRLQLGNRQTGICFQHVTTELNRMFSITRQTVPDCPGLSSPLSLISILWIGLG